MAWLVYLSPVEAEQWWVWYGIFMGRWDQRIGRTMNRTMDRASRIAVVVGIHFS